MGFEEFDAVPKRVAKFEALVIGNRNAIDHFTAGGREPVPPAGQILYEICYVRLCPRAIDPVLSTKMYLKVTELQPESAASRERLRFWHLDEPKHTAVEGSCFVLGSDRYADLRVVRGLYHPPIFPLILASTISGISPSILPPSSKTCFISVEETYENSSPAIRNTVSIEGSSRRFIKAIRSSYS